MICVKLNLASGRSGPCKDAELQIFANGLTDIRLWGGVVALAVELTFTGKFTPSLKMVGGDPFFGLMPCHTYRYVCELFTVSCTWFVHVVVILLHPESYHAGDGRCPCKSDAVQ